MNLNPGEFPAWVLYKLVEMPDMEALGSDEIVENGKDYWVVMNGLPGALQVPGYCGLRGKKVSKSYSGASHWVIRRKGTGKGTRNSRLKVKALPLP